MVLAASFQDCVLIDVAVRAVPEIEVVFLDTQYHFAETHWYVERVRERYDLNLTVMEPLIAPDDLWQTDPDECCAMRKVEPLARALARQAGVDDRVCAGSRRRLGRTRRSSDLDVGRGIVKVNPLAPWTDADIAGYKRDHELLEHPLASQGYPSIGCWPCTRPVAEGDDPRAGRWAGRGKDGVRPARLARDLNPLDRDGRTNPMRRIASHLVGARSRVDPPPARGRGRVRAAGAAVLGRQGQRRDGARRRPRRSGPRSSRSR